MAIFMGVLPNLFLKPMEASVNRVIERVTGRQPAQVQVPLPAAERDPTRERPQRAEPVSRTTMTDYAAIIPLLIVALAGAAAMLAEAFRQPGERMPIAGLGLIGLAGAAVASVFLWGTDRSSFGVIRADNFALFINIMLCIIGVLTMLFSNDVVEREQLPAGEYYALTLFAICGMMMMAAAIDLLVIFIALEILSLAVYVLTGLRRASVTGAEAAFKYFLLGSFSSAFFLYGIAFLYAVAGSTRLEQISVALSAQGASAPPTLAILGVGLLAVGFAFKVSAVPFHMWTPDAYEGAPTIVTAFMSTGVKAAAFAAFARVFLSPLEPLQAQWVPVLSVDRRADDDPRHGRRRRADQHQAHARLFEHRARRLPAARHRRRQPRRQGRHPLLPAVVRRVEPRRARHRRAARTPENEHDELRDFAGLKDSRPGLAALMTVFLLSLGGFPPLAGLHRQVVHLQRGGPGRALLAGDHRRADQRRLGVLLPAHRRDDVDDRGSGGGAAAHPGHGGRRPGAGDDCRLLPRRPADARPAAGAGFDPDDFLIAGPGYSAPIVIFAFAAGFALQQVAPEARSVGAVVQSFARTTPR